MVASDRMARRSTIELTVPGGLAYRAVAVRVIAEACRLVSAPDAEPSTAIGPAYDVRDPFDTAVVSAFAEIFNNIAIHAYQRRGSGAIEVTVEYDQPITPTAIIVEIRDHGAAFDIDAVASPDLDALPEGGMGIHIARTLLDELAYEPGPPNLWRMVKRLTAGAEPLPPPAEGRG
jgi:anti-sigma regulatory factor (Ser/Thr protein kinase)